MDVFVLYGIHVLEVDFCQSKGSDRHNWNDGAKCIHWLQINNKQLKGKVIFEL